MFQIVFLLSLRFRIAYFIDRGAPLSVPSAPIGPCRPLSALLAPIGPIGPYRPLSIFC